MTDSLPASPAAREEYITHVLPPRAGMYDAACGLPRARGPCAIVAGAEGFAGGRKAHDPARTPGRGFDSGGLAGWGSISEIRKEQQKSIRALAPDVHARDTRGGKGERGVRKHAHGKREIPRALVTSRWPLAARWPCRCSIEPAKVSGPVVRAGDFASRFSDAICRPALRSWT